MFHFAGSMLNENVTDNLLVNPYVGWEFNAFFDFDIRGGILSPRSADGASTTPGANHTADSWTSRSPAGASRSKTTSTSARTSSPCATTSPTPRPGATYGLDGLYAGESFYATTEHIYNRTWVGYDRKFFHDTLHVEAGMVFHYDGTGMGTQQVVQLSVDIQRLFNIGPKRPAHRHGPLH